MHKEFRSDSHIYYWLYSYKAGQFACFLNWYGTPVDLLLWHLEKKKVLLPSVYVHDNYTLWSYKVYWYVLLSHDIIFNSWTSQTSRYPNTGGGGVAWIRRLSKKSIHYKNSNNLAKMWSVCWLVQGVAVIFEQCYHHKIIIIMHIHIDCRASGHVTN